MMQKFKAFIQQFNWKIVLIRILVNGASLALTVLIIPDISFVTQNYWTVVISAIGLGILNAFVKPLILLLTGQFIFATFGLLVILVNALMLYLLEWLFPNMVPQAYSGPLPRRLVVNTTTASETSTTNPTIAIFSA